MMINFSVQIFSNSAYFCYLKRLKNLFQQSNDILSKTDFFKKRTLNFFKVYRRHEKKHTMQGHFIMVYYFARV